MVHRALLSFALVLCCLAVSLTAQSGVSYVYDDLGRLIGVIDQSPVPEINRANGNPATRYISPSTGQSVVRDNVTGEIIHVGGPGFKYFGGGG